MKKYKSNIQRLNESRRVYKSILSERVTDGVDALERMNSMQDTDMEELGVKTPKPVKPEIPPKSTSGTYDEITMKRCGQTTNPNASTVTWYGRTIGGNAPTVGMVVDMTAAGGGPTGNWEVTIVDSNSTTPCTSPGNVNGVCDIPVGSCGGSTTCDFPTISAGCASTSDLTNQFVNSPSQFLSNMATWYANPPGANDGCHFLEVVRQKHLGHLSTGIAINANNPNGAQMGPLWIAQKTSKVSYLDCVLSDLNSQGCCSGKEGGGSNTEMSKPKPIIPVKPIRPVDPTIQPSEPTDPVFTSGNPHDNFDALEEQYYRSRENRVTKTTKKRII
jgi:hypothetical protein|tara:strand:+ start:6389 stop:7381 length:993 start_codon:yes stop_codon:yes gene_type:complete